jgi:hypothetical protein
MEKMPSAGAGVAFGVGEVRATATAATAVLPLACSCSKCAILQSRAVVALGEARADLTLSPGTMVYRGRLG